jgi:hypothetical protein
MRVRITRTPPHDYGVEIDSLLVGRIYNLDASLASALMIDGCAELYDLLSPAEKRNCVDGSVREGWTPGIGPRPRWKLPQA